MTRAQALKSLMLLVSAGVAACARPVDLSSAQVDLRIDASPGPSRARCASQERSADRRRCEIRRRFREGTCAEAVIRWFDGQLASSRRPRSRTAEARAEARWPEQVINACGKVYCDRLPRPRPALCARLPVSANPADSYRDLNSFVNAIDGHLGGDDLFRALYGRNHRGLCFEPPHGGGSKLTLKLHQTGSAVRVRAQGSLRAEWRIPLTEDGSSFQPVITAMGKARFAGTPSIHLENLIGVGVVRRLTNELASAGWCSIEHQRCNEQSPGGYRCDLPKRGADALTVIGKGSPYSSAQGEPILLVSRDALHFRGRRVVELRNGTVPENYLTDFRGGYLIHPLRKAFQADPPDRIVVLLDPGVTLSCYLEQSFRYTAWQAARPGSGRRDPIPFEIHCKE